MKNLTALSVALLLITGFSVPSTASTVFSVSQKTLSPFRGSITTLTTQQKAQVKAVVDSNPRAEKFICTGIRFESAPMSENIVVRKRAKAACDYAKVLNPALSTFFQNKPTKARSFAGKVLLTVKSRAGVSGEIRAKLFQPIPPQLATPVTWENLLERADEIHAINFNDTFATLERNTPLVKSPTVKRSYFRGPNLEAKHYAELESWLAKTDALYARSVPLDSQIFLMFPFEDVEWAVKKISAPEVNHPGYKDIILNANETPRQGVRQNAVPNLAQGRFDGIWLLPATLDGYYGFSGLARNEAAMLYHEQVHQHQQAQWKDENLNGPNFGMGRATPCFIVEGMATTPEFVLISENVSEYEGFVRDRVRGAYTSDPDTSDALGNFTGYSPLTEKVTVEFAEAYLQNSFAENCSYGLQYGLSYSLGYLATEALVAIKGYESPMGLLTLMGLNDLSWDEAFKHVFEISWDDAMPILAQYVSLKALEYRG